MAQRLRVPIPEREQPLSERPPVQPPARGPAALHRPGDLAARVPAVQTRQRSRCLDRSPDSAVRIWTAPAGPSGASACRAESVKAFDIAWLKPAAGGQRVKGRNVSAVSPSRRKSLKIDAIAPTARGHGNEEHHDG